MFGRLFSFFRNLFSHSAGRSFDGTFSRLRTLIIKELLALLRDKQSRIIVIMPVLMQVLIFPFAATLEITHSSIGVFSEDSGKHAVELTQRLAKAKSFSQVLLLHSDQEVKEAIDNQKILLLVRFGPEFSRNLEAGQTASLQVILDGRRSNGGQIASNYVQGILQQYQKEIMTSRGINPKFSSELVFRNWYNPNLDYKWFIVPSLVALITTVGVLIVTALSVAREREQGTLEQLLVSPLSTWQIFVGKAVPAQIIATLQGSIILIAAIFFYKIPFSGSLLLFYGMILLYGFSLIGVGLLISSLCSTQQQAFIGVFLFMMPCILLSGYVSPIENMPQWLQYATMINPIRHFTEITKQIYLKDADFAVLWQSIWPLLIIIVCSVTVAYRIFRRKIG